MMICHCEGLGWMMVLSARTMVKRPLLSMFCTPLVAKVDPFNSGSCGNEL
jgi:hypothetical protein